MLKPYTCPCVLGRIGIWKGWFLERGENRRTQRKTSRRGREPTTNSYHFIYLKHEKGTPFNRSLPIKAIIGSTGTPLPRGREASALTTAPLLPSFQRQKPIHLLYLFFLLYLHKKGSSSLSTSLIHNKYFAKFVPVYFLIQGNVTLGLMFAICRKRDSKYLDFPLTTTSIH